MKRSITPAERHYRQKLDARRRRPLTAAEKKRLSRAGRAAQMSLLSQLTDILEHLRDANEHGLKHPFVAVLNDVLQYHKLLPRKHPAARMKAIRLHAGMLLNRSFAESVKASAARLNHTIQRHLEGARKEYDTDTGNENNAALEAACRDNEPLGGVLRIRDEYENRMREFDRRRGLCEKKPDEPACPRPVRKVGKITAAFFKTSMNSMKSFETLNLRGEQLTLPKSLDIRRPQLTDFFFLRGLLWEVFAGTHRNPMTFYVNEANQQFWKEHS
jgi:hypothetical protein